MVRIGRDTLFGYEVLSLGDLGKHILTDEINETGAKQITRDLLEALIIIRDEGFTHRDIKLQVRSLRLHFVVRYGILVIYETYDYLRCPLNNPRIYS